MAKKQRKSSKSVVRDISLFVFISLFISLDINKIAAVVKEKKRKVLEGEVDFAKTQRNTHTHKKE